MNSEEKGRSIPVFQLSLGVINSKANYKVIKRGNVQQRLYQKKFFLNLCEQRSQAIILGFSCGSPVSWVMLCGSTVYFSRADTDKIWSSTSVEK